MGEERRLDFSKVFPDICKNDPAAVEFCHAYLAWCHFIDDMVDGDQPEFPPDDIVRINLEVAMVCAFNPFFQKHKRDLLPLVVQSANAFSDSVEWALDPDINKRRAADVLKTQYADVFWQVARICGGHEHMEKMTRTYRLYQHDAD